MGNEEITKRKKKVTNQAIHDLELRRWVGGRWVEWSAAGSRQPWAAVEAGGVRNLGFRVGWGSITGGYSGMVGGGDKPGGGFGLWAARPVAMAPPAGWWRTVVGRG